MMEKLIITHVIPSAVCVWGGNPRTPPVTKPMGVARAGHSHRGAGGTPGERCPVGGKPGGVMQGMRMDALTCPNARGC